MPEPEWLIRTTQYDGFPIALRVRPAAGGPSIKESYPHLGVLSHTLARVRKDGMPEPAYNATLEEFDGAVHALLEKDTGGIIMIVETFGGERNYYACVRDEQAHQRWIEDVSRRFPEHDLSDTFKSHAAATFYRKYREDFEW